MGKVRPCQFTWISVENIRLLNCQLPDFRVIAVDNRPLGFGILHYHDVAFTAHGKVISRYSGITPVLNNLICTGRQVLPFRVSVSGDLHPHRRRAFCACLCEVLHRVALALRYSDLIFLSCCIFRRTYYVLLDDNIPLVTGIRVRRGGFYNLFLLSDRYLFRSISYAGKCIAFDLRDIRRCFSYRISAKRQVTCLSSFSRFHGKCFADIGVSLVCDYECEASGYGQRVSILVLHEFGDFDFALVLFILVDKRYRRCSIFRYFTCSRYSASILDPGIVLDDIRIPCPGLFFHCICSYRQFFDLQRFGCTYFKLMLRLAECRPVFLQVLARAVLDCYLEHFVFISGHISKKLFRDLQFSGIKRINNRCKSCCTFISIYQTGYFSDRYSFRGSIICRKLCYLLPIIYNFFSIFIFRHA